MKWSERVNFTPIPWPYHPNINGISPLMQRYTKDYIAFNRGNACILAWIDPFDDMIADLNSLAFRVGVHASRPEYRPELTSGKYLSLDPNFTIEYEVQGRYISKINVFKTDYLFFFGAAILQIICVGVITYTFYGWWRLGRAVTFSPLEVAKAFETPLLASSNSNANVDSMAKELRERRLRPGMVGTFKFASMTEADRLAFEEPHIVPRPTRGAVFRH